MLGAIFTSFIATRLGKLLPSWAWEIVFIALLVGGALLFHHAQVVRHDNGVRATQQAADNAKWQRAFDKEHQAALAWKAKTEQQGATIANEERKIHDQAIADNAALAAALSVRGPGAATSHCGPGNHPTAPAPSGGPDKAPSGTSTPAAQVPSDDWAVVPWSWLVRVAQEHDDMRVKLKVIFDNDAKQRAAWPKK